MFNGQKILAIIPARGGSKGIPQKNIKNFCGIPLIAWTIKAAKKSKYLDRIILSSDDDNIINIAESFGCEAPFKRSQKLARDDTPGIDVIHDALNRCLGYDWVIVLQPTSPLRTSLDIDLALEYCIKMKAPACVSVSEVTQSPYWMFLLDEDSKMSAILDDETCFSRRQDAPSFYTLNGAVYVAKISWLRNGNNFKSFETVAYIMPQERSVDIDSELDFEYAAWSKKSGDLKN